MIDVDDSTVSESWLRLTGTVRELHGTDPTRVAAVQRTMDTSLSGCAVLWCDFVDRALVLGSRQDTDIVPARRRGELARRKVDLVVRRSGGGAVLMEPDALLWIDVVGRPGALPNDVVTSMVRVGRAWVAGLRNAAAVPAAAAMRVHHGGLDTGQWGELVCFAGRGPGEVIVGGRKLVGLSQRRTKDGVRISGAVHRRSLTSATARLLDGGLPDSLETAAEIEDVDAARVARAIADALIEPSA